MQIFEYLENTCNTIENKEGVCTTIDRCPNIIDEYYFALGQSTIPSMSFDEFLKKTACGEINSGMVSFSP